jgi:hypothetical protein
MLRIEAGSRKTEPLHRAAMQEVFVDDLIYIFELDEAVPDRLGIDDDNRAMLALVEAARLVGANKVLQSCVLNSVLERKFELFTSLGQAAWTGRVLVTLVGANEEMMLKFRHGRPFFLFAAFAAVNVRRRGLSETI